MVRCAPPATGARPGLDGLLPFQDEQRRHQLHLSAPEVTHGVLPVVPKGESPSHREGAPGRADDPLALASIDGYRPAAADKAARMCSLWMETPPVAGEPGSDAGR